MRLKEDKIYVGVTSKTPKNECKNTFDTITAPIVPKKYKPLEIIERKSIGVTTYEEALVFENIRVRELIKEKGIDNVRGGSITSAQMRNEDSTLVDKLGYIVKSEDYQASQIMLFFIAIIFLLGLAYYFK